VLCLWFQVEHGIESIDNRAKTVGGEVQSCIRANILALEDKERELLLQVVISPG